MLNVLRRSAAHRRVAESLALAIGLRARAPEFFQNLGVPDTFNGRFDMVALHTWLVLERLEVLGAKGISQALINGLFYSFEDALRDQGAGDMGMTRRIKAIADAFYGRLNAYRGAAGREELRQALLRNVYGGEVARENAAGSLADYAAVVRARLSPQTLADGALDFGPLDFAERDESVP